MPGNNLGSVYSIEQANDDIDRLRVGDNVVSARILDKNDISKLMDINDKVNASYWINSKRNVTEKYNNYSFNAFTVIVGRFNDSDIVLNNIYLYLNADDFIEYYTGFKNGTNSYTAGLRPVIKVKVDGLKKLSSSEIAKIEKRSSVVDKSFFNDQSTRNKDYNTSKEYLPSTSSQGPVSSENNDLII